MRPPGGCITPAQPWSCFDPLQRQATGTPDKLLCPWHPPLHPAHPELAKTSSSSHGLESANRLLSPRTAAFPIAPAHPAAAKTAAFPGGHWSLFDPLRRGCPRRILDPCGTQEVLTTHYRCRSPESRRHLTGCCLPHALDRYKRHKIK
jgi:hypothetical protein